jgi:hypothetical protein
MVIDNIVYITTGNSIMTNFITKYHDNHKLNMYRLIKNNQVIQMSSLDIVKDVLNNIGLDLLCVAAHYSETYINGDNFLLTKDNESIKYQVLYFSNRNTETIINDFIEKCIDKGTNIESNITWKNMHYIWKLYLSQIEIPNMIYSQQLQEILLSKLKHTIEGNNTMFNNVTSKYLPSVGSFLSFWDKYIIIVDEDTKCSDEYEIDELASLYKNSDTKIINLSDADILKMISHYFSPQVEIIDNKYIRNIRCSLWLKDSDIISFLISYKADIINGIKNVNSDIISLDDLYDAYKSWVKAVSIVEKRTNLIVSKQFFQLFVSNELKEFIQFEKFITSIWFQKN